MRTRALARTKAPLRPETLSWVSAHQCYGVVPWRARNSPLVTLTPYIHGNNRFDLESFPGRYFSYNEFYLHIGSGASVPLFFFDRYNKNEVGPRTRQQGVGPLGAWSSPLQSLELTIAGNVLFIAETFIVEYSIEKDGCIFTFPGCKSRARRANF